jgi:uncharacterized membrane protein YfcA
VQGIIRDQVAIAAAAAHRLPTRRLKQVFALLLYGLTAKMLVSLW